MWPKWWSYRSTSFVKEYLCVSFKFIPCVQFEIPLYTPQSASGMMRIKLHEGLITFQPALHMMHPFCSQCCFFLLPLKFLNLFLNLLKFWCSELFLDQVQTKTRKNDKATECKSLRPIWTMKLVQAEFLHK